MRVWIRFNSWIYRLKGRLRNWYICLLNMLHHAAAAAGL